MNLFEDRIQRQYFKLITNSLSLFTIMLIYQYLKIKADLLDDYLRKWFFIDNFHIRQNFDLGKNKTYHHCYEGHLKIRKLKNLVASVENYKKYSLARFAYFVYICTMRRKSYMRQFRSFCLYRQLVLTCKLFNIGDQFWWDSVSCCGLVRQNY